MSVKSELNARKCEPERPSLIVPTHVQQHSIGIINLKQVTELDSFRVTYKLS